MPDNSRAILILAGGAGTRLWPLSTDARPKQFLRIFDGHSLIEKTFERLARHAPPSNIFVSTNAAYRELVAEQLPLLPPENILVEPSRRNTGPAIAACCAAIERRLGDLVVGIFPSDHAIREPEAFRLTVDRAFEFASHGDSLVTIGIQPTEPHTGFGYLELDSPIDEPVYRLKRFVEKPSIEKATEFLASGRFLWNGGMFVWRLGVFFAAFEKASPEIVQNARAWSRCADPVEARRIFDSMPSISIDYALMEKAQNVATVRGSFGWSDVGSWGAVAEIIGRAVPPGCVVDHAENVFILGETGRPVAVVGAGNVFVIDSPDGVLVLDAKSGERLSQVVKEIESRRRAVQLPS